LILSASGGIILSIFVLLHTGLDALVAPMALAGGGNGLFFTPNSTISMLSVPADKRGETSGIRTLMTNLGSVLGLTLVFFALVSRIPAAIVNDVFLGVSVGVPSGVSNLFSSATFLAFFVSSLICLSSIPVLLFLRNRKMNRL
ncbi:MAG TPA: hypothetical protein VKU79_02310, partial [Thermoplasmataceae archaeon]|nr:hypothetical protein [Thermoplasmataceae archaeon]